MKSPAHPVDGARLIEQAHNLAQPGRLLPAFQGVRQGICHCGWIHGLFLVTTESSVSSGWRDSIGEIKHPSKWISKSGTDAARKARRNGS